MENRTATTSDISTRTLLFICILLCANIMRLDAQAKRNQFEQNVKGIQDGDFAAIARAGDSRNPAYIPYLRAILTSTPAYRSPHEEEAVVSLVRLGDKEERSELECDLLANDPDTVDYLAETMFPRIKGWFAIRAYYYMLSHDEAYIANLKQAKYQSDVVHSIYPSYWAAWYLPRIIPHSPFPVVKTVFDPRISSLSKQWKIWIQRNRVQLEHTWPYGKKGLTFSNAGCPVEKR